MKRAGLTIIEALVALSIMGIALAFLAPSFVGYSKVNTDSEIRGEAVAAAQQVLDTLRRKDFNTWPTSGTAENFNASSRTYSSKITYCTPIATPSSSCYSTASTRHVKVEVTYNEKIVYQVETVFTDFE
jgi:type II secretory pathway pseudopilin PulG